MEAKELRIGNIIQSTEFKNPFSIDYQIIGFVMLEPDKYEPVELTPEWLEKFGFKKRATVAHSTQWFIGLNPINQDWLFDILWLDNEPAPFYRNGYFMIKHVHQLQNLYNALTGEELV